jgi:hypothetical protein
MLRLEKIEFTDKLNRTYTVYKSQVERFPLIGGENANQVTTKVWNQHGNTYENSFMESFSGDLTFALLVNDLTPAQIEAERRKVTEICNPLNGEITMKVKLNSGAVYHRDITFVSAPFFPTGFTNRNKEWQRVQLQFEANNPFYYSSDEIVESFLGVEPLFHFPFVMSPEDPVHFGNVVPNNVAINRGQAEAPVVIRIVGRCVNPRITNVRTGEFIAFRNLTMNATDELIIDTTFGQKRVELNGGNVFNRLDFASTFFNLQIGSNEISFTDETQSNEATIYFIYRSLYITI